MTEHGNGKVFSGLELVKHYGKRTVVDKVSIEVHKGEVVGLLGPNGAGKTTTFYMMTGMIRPSSGTVFLNGKDVSHAAMYARAQAGVAYLPQEASIFRKLTVEQNIQLILETLDFTKTQRQERLEFLLNELSIAHLRKNKGYQLSGGERRRTEICRALVTEPDFILLDEPFAGVDPIAVEDIQSIVLKLKARNIGVLITDHNVHETLSITDRAYLLFQGKILLSGTAEYLANDEKAKTLYLGSNFRLDR
ncbi:MAG: LPS export ABC transporter ATP-binding protein [Candidatus Marinimicrobia bacterium]|nr:LPS export ABC transporter ATP-binding protein [Candidatus Neomarinimicrobiota bacterium]MCF7840546.1 LPS export ABC transporter ATP-binding protein [Candidatus Neomarinimicrobiota bacterium]